MATMPKVGWSPSAEQAIIQVQQQQEKPTLFSSPFVQDFISRAADNDEKQRTIGEIAHLENKMLKLLATADSDEVASILVELETIAIEGKAADAEMTRFESETLAYRNADLQREQTLVKCNRAVNNLKGNAPNRFATRIDIAEHEAKIKDAGKLAAEAEADIRTHSMDLQMHMQNLNAAKLKVKQLLGREHSLKSRLAYLRGEAAPAAASTRPTSFSSTGLGSSR
jgi:hypothetical protein